ncbi:MAG: glyceraldehyde-3-phosphate dehydrogenase, partial [Deltaproteobacteria bacterium]|nr:glyceraldehyde-3-phosphate dehydrogenase [Deltaproteobacteria bacterium]
MKRRQPAAPLAISIVVATILTTAGLLWAAGGGLFEDFRDPTDGAFDASDWLLNKRGVLAVPIII